MQQTHVRLRIMLRGCRRLSFEYIFYECGRGPSSSMRKHCDSAMIWYNVHVLCIQYLVCKVTQALSACLIFGFVYILLKGLWSDRAVWNVLRNVLWDQINCLLDFHISYSIFGFPFLYSIFGFPYLYSVFGFPYHVISVEFDIGWLSLCSAYHIILVVFLPSDRKFCFSPVCSTPTWRLNQIKS